MRASVVAAAVAGVVVGLVEAVLAAARAEAAPASGLVTILGADVTAALVVGAVQGLLLAALVTPAALADLVRGAARAMVPAAPAVEATRLARAMAAAAAVAAAALVVWRVDRGAVSAVRVDPEVTVRATITAGLGLAGVGLGAVALAAALGPLLERACRRGRRIVSLRSLVLVAIAAAVIGLVVALPALEPLARAFDLRGPAVVALFGVLEMALLAVLVTAARGDALVRRATGPLALGVAAAVLAGAWLVALGPASDDRAAVRLYRREAPLTGVVIGGLARALDRDGDGYSAHFGDGDCAPGDRARHPAAIDRPGDGVDQDCFDGDLAPAAIGAPPPPAARPALPADVSFVLVFIDTLRPDHLGAYGHDRPTSPNIDRLARDAIVFERAYAPSTFTSASLAAFVTARPPGQVSTKILARDEESLPADVPTVLEAFRAAGWRTAVVTDLAASAPAAFRGAETARGLHRRPADVVPTALEVLEPIAGGRFVLVVYFAGPHAPYRRRENAPDFGAELVDLYDSALAYTDAQLTRLLDRLDAPDLRDRVVVAMLSDHGEAFGEHGVHYHGRNVHDETTRIPMILRVPGLPARRVGGAPVSLLDVVPTILNLAGLPPLPGARGHDLTGALVSGTLDPDRRVVVEADYPGAGYQAAVVDARFKLIHEAASRTFLLHDLVADPGETRDVASSHPDALTALRRALAAERSLHR